VNVFGNFWATEEADSLLVVADHPVEIRDLESDGAHGGVCGEDVLGGSHVGRSGLHIT
jgi:hypothetical protein